MHPLVQSFQEAFRQEPAWEQKIFSPPATEQEITHFKEKVKNWKLPDLPEIFYDLYRWHNGSRYTKGFPENFHDGEIILPFHKIISKKEIWDELEQQNTFYQYERGTWWNTAWIPFLYIPSWWIGVIDMAGCFGGRAGQIICFDFKSAEPKTARHQSFEKWLETMLVLKQNDVLMYKTDEDGDIYELSEKEQQQKTSIEEAINGDFVFQIEMQQYKSNF